MKADTQPNTNWMSTAMTRGILLPYLKEEKFVRNVRLDHKTGTRSLLLSKYTYANSKILNRSYLSEKMLNIMFPNNIPNIVISCAKFANCECSHTKSH